LVPNVGDPPPSSKRHLASSLGCVLLILLGPVRTGIRSWVQLQRPAPLNPGQFQRPLGQRLAGLRAGKMRAEIASALFDLPNGGLVTSINVTPRQAVSTDIREDIR